MLFRSLHGDVSNIADADSARNSCGQSLEVGNFTGLVELVFLSPHDPDRVHEAADVDEAEVEGEEGSADNQPDDDQRELRAPN